uniref:Uridylate-specific endoribonuclease n=1 Tax=Oncorhynchus tshawytscha TaxID=74940 RepID=A0A8C8HW39_ONCTS
NNVITSLCYNSTMIIHALVVEIPAVTSLIPSLSKALYALDSNKPSASELIIDSQARVPVSQTCSQNDLCSLILFFLCLLCYFFLSLISSLFFLSLNQCDLTSSPGCYGSEEKFLHDLKMMWFDLYSCYPGKMDSSGFEQCIFASVGEIKCGKISGFHNWLQFYWLEKQGLIDYYSHSFDRPWTSYPDFLGMQFTWDGYFKQVGSAIIGCSSELAMYSLCYITRPGKQCKQSLGGKPLVIQTYTWEHSSYGNGKKYIGSSMCASDTIAYCLTPQKN